MRASSRGQTKRSNRRPDKVVGKPDVKQISAGFTVELTDRTCKLARTIWPAKTAQFLAIYGEVTPRQAERILAGRQKITLAVIGHLLGSEYASRFYWAFLESFGSHVFWTEQRKRLRAITLRESINAQQQELRELEEGRA